jgi:hypothetical protein
MSSGGFAQEADNCRFGIGGRQYSLEPTIRPLLLFGIEEVFSRTLLKLSFSSGDFYFDQGAYHSPPKLVCNGLGVVNVFDPLFFPTTADAFRDHFQPPDDRVLRGTQLPKSSKPVLPFLGIELLIESM